MEKNYTFESWLNDEIEIKILGESVMDTLGLRILVNRQMLAQDQLDKIMEKQEWTFDVQLEIRFHYLTTFFIERLENIKGSKGEYLSTEIEIKLKKYNEISAEARRRVLDGNKNFNHIKGSQYIKVKEIYEIWQKDNSKYGFYIGSENFGAWVTKSYLDWLQRFKLNRSSSGFQSNLQEQQIDYLFQLLRERFINPNTKQDHFRAIFRNEPLPLDFEKIRKQKVFTNSLLAYFIQELFQKNNPNDYWSIAEKCFVAKNLKQSATGYFITANQKPKGFEEIDSILEIIDRPLL